MPDYTDKFLGLRLYTKCSLCPTTRTQRKLIAVSWSALFYYIGTRLLGFGHLLTGRRPTRNGKSLVGPVAPNYV